MATSTARPVAIKISEAFKAWLTPPKARVKRIGRCTEPVRNFVCEA